MDKLDEKEDKSSLEANNDDETDNDDEDNEDEELHVVFLPLEKGYNAEQVVKAAEVTIGESLYSLITEKNGVRLVFYPGEFSGPRPLETAEFIIKLREICQKEGVNNENRPDDQ